MPPSASKALLSLPLLCVAAVAEPDPSSALDRFAEAVRSAIERSPELARVVADLDADAADTSGALAPGLPWIEGEIQDRRFPGGGHADGSASLRLGVPFRYPWHWATGAELAHRTRDWRALAGRSAVLETTLELGAAWVKWTVALEEATVAEGWLQQADAVLAQGRRKLTSGTMSQVDGAWMELRRADIASRAFEARTDAEVLSSEVRRIAGDTAPTSRPGDLAVLLSTSSAPIVDLAALEARMRESSLYLASLAEAERDRAEGLALTRAALGTPRLELGLRQDVEEMFAWDLEGALALRIPIPAGRQVATKRAEGRAMARSGEASVDSTDARFRARLRAAEARVRTAQAWADALGAALAAEKPAEVSLASQYRLGDLSEVDYLRDMDRLLGLRRQSLEAARLLLLARLELAVLVEDASIFPAVVPVSR